jgi:hypothetical protein
LHVTIVFPAASVTSMTSTTGWYLISVSSFHSNMAAIPRLSRFSSRTPASVVKQAATATASRAFAPAM